MTAFGRRKTVAAEQLNAATAYPSSPRQGVFYLIFPQADFPVLSL